MQLARCACVPLAAGAVWLALSPKPAAQGRLASHAPQPHAAATGVEAKLVAGDAQAVDLFGEAVALDGDTAAIGAPYEDEAGQDAGAVYVFERAGGAWTQQAKLLAADAVAGDLFGGAVALSGDTLLVGAKEAQGVGAAYVFVRSAGAWSQEAKLTAPVTTAAWLGFSVSVLDDRAVVGAQWDTTGNGAGSAFVFERSGTSWGPPLRLAPSDGSAIDLFGYAVAQQGDVVTVGAPLEDGAAGDAGAVYVWRFDGLVWNEEAKLTAADAKFADQLGFALALDTGTLLASAIGDSDGGSSAGSCYVFVESGGAWSQQDELRSGDLWRDDELGWSVALEGDTAVLGAWRDDEAGPDTGAAYAFRRSGGRWWQLCKLLAPDAAGGDQLGRAIALSAGRVLVGAPGDDDAGTQSGSAYSFLLGEPFTLYCTAKLNSQGCTPAIAASGSASVSSSAPFPIRALSVINNKPGLFFYGLAGPATLPFQGGLLCVAPPITRTFVQGSGGNPPPDDCSGSLLFDFNAWLQSGADPALAPGAQVHGQLWYRDPAHPDGTGTGLSNAIALDVCA